MPRDGVREDSYSYEKDKLAQLVSAPFRKIVGGCEKLEVETPRDYQRFDAEDGSNMANLGPILTMGQLTEQLTSSPDTKKLSSTSDTILQPGAEMDQSPISPISRKYPISIILQAGYVGSQGLRAAMEDYHVMLVHPKLNRMVPIVDTTNRHLFGIFDGHGGRSCAKYFSKTIASNLIEQPYFISNNAEALTRAIVQTDEKFCNIIRRKGYLDCSGTTAIVAYIVDDQLIVANVGDSRAVLCRAGCSIPLSFDHKPDRKDEHKRIIELGGFVSRSEPTKRSNLFLTKMRDLAKQIIFSCCRVPMPILPPYRIYPGGLAMSRTLGDLQMKATRLVINTPEIVQRTITHEDEFIILGCDGIWDVMSSTTAIRHTRNYRKRHGNKPLDAAKNLASLASLRGSRDNISVMVIYLRKIRTKIQGRQ